MRRPIDVEIGEQAAKMVFKHSSEFPMPKQFAPFAILSIVFMNTSAHAQASDASPERTLWDHNESVMYLIENGSSREFFYEKPRPGMLEAGARPGALLFRGEVDGEQYSGTAHIFNSRCGQLPFQVKGAILDNGERIVLTGQAPLVGRNCKAHGSYSSTLEFKRLKSATDSLSPSTQKEDKPKPDVGLTGGDTPGISSAQVAAANDAPTTANEVTGQIVRPSTGTPLPQRDGKWEFFGNNLDNHALAGAITVLVGALLCLCGVKLSRKHFWPRGF